MVTLRKNLTLSILTFTLVNSYALQAHAQTAIYQQGTLNAPTSNSQAKVCPYYKNYSDKISAIVLREYTNHYRQPLENNKWNNYDGYSWCALFARAAFVEAGFSVPRIDNSRALLEKFGANGKKKNQPNAVFTNPEYAAPGDLVVWKENGSSYKGHTGVVVENDCNKRIIKTVEGNAEKRMIRAISYTYENIKIRKHSPDQIIRHTLYGFGRWYE